MFEVTIKGRYTENNKCMFINTFEEIEGALQYIEKVKKCANGVKITLSKIGIGGKNTADIGTVEKLMEIDG